jgi:hypothetical protein
MNVYRIALWFLCGLYVQGQTFRSREVPATPLDFQIEPGSINGTPVSTRGAASAAGITYTCDPSVNAIVGVCNTLNTTIAGLYASIFSNATASIYVTFGSTSLGASLTLRFPLSYSAFRSALQSHLTDTTGSTAFNNNVPAINPINSSYGVALKAANLRALGITVSGGLKPDGTTCTLGVAGCYDGIITVSSSVQAAGNLYFRQGSIGPTQYDFYSVVEHETDEFLGTASCAFNDCGGNNIRPADLFRYHSDGTRSFSPGTNDSCSVSSSTNACFSIDGVKMLQHYNNINDGRDAGDWSTNCASPLVQDANGCLGVANLDISTSAEIPVLDAVGFALNGAVAPPLTVNTALTSDSTGIVNGVCSTPATVTSFTVNSPQVWLFFSVNGGNTGDVAQMTFYRPDGAVYTTLTSSPLVTSGTACFSRSIDINGAAAASFPGNWTVRVFWNQSTTPLLTEAFLVMPLSCTYVLSSGGQAFNPFGGTANVGIAAPGCPWMVSGVPTWVTLFNPNGTGNATISYQVAPNIGGDRSGTLTIAGVSYLVEQEGLSVSGLNFIGSMPHIAAEENWTTAFTLVNKGAGSATARLNLFGDPTGILALPLTFPQQAAVPAPELAASFDRTIPSNASLIIDTAGPQTPPVQIGSAQLFGTGAVDGFAIFHLIPGSQEAVVPMETRSANSYLLAYDNTGGVVLGVAVQNVSAQAGSVAVVIRDDTGLQIGTGNIPMLANGHTSFVLSDPVSGFPITANKRGTIEFDTPAGGQISVLGIRTTPLGGSTTLTTIPALANVGTKGGSIAHIATGNGWQTTFVLVNTGASAAQVNLNFFADVTGAPLALPLSFPQTGTGSTASSVSQSLAAGASLLIQSAAPLSNPAPTIGSAQLTTTGNVGGFVIFRYNPNGQEAVVPLESRSATAYILAFDNTAGTATGIALNSVSSQAVSVPVIVRDDTGAQIANDTLNLAANGHLAFTLVSDKYAATANIRGTIEFDTPPGGQIGALGIRIPVAHTFTTLPALVR